LWAAENVFALVDTDYGGLRNVARKKVIVNNAGGDFAGSFCE